MQPDAQQAPHEEGPARSCANSTQPKRTAKSGSGTEWRVRWWRIGWRESTPWRVRIFAREVDAAAFVRTLTSGDRPDLSAVRVEVHRRPVPDWEPALTIDEHGIVEATP